MNSIWNKNISLFKKRFPDLAQILKKDIDDFFTSEHKKPLIIQQAKNGSPTAFFDSMPVHSKYNPEREAEQFLSSIDYKNASASIFMGTGLGYAIISFAKNNPSIPILIVESEVDILLQAFCTLDWKIVLQHKEISFIINAPYSTPAQILETNYNNIEKSVIFISNALISHNPEYFKQAKEAIIRQKQKANINTNTLERFAHLWLKNSCRNMKQLALLDGVNSFFSLANEPVCNLPFIILAAGPSLQDILPHLKELKKRAILVCVDTALHACLRYGVEPDFIVLVDPQYVCACHLNFLSAPSSILITESATWPSVFRFKCKKIIMCSSLFPIGQYFEKHLGIKGKLGAGGSVTTTAWDFARCCGARRIFIAGMDFGFPKGQTHIRGSQFEERSHRTSTRLHTNENDTIASITSANVSKALDYDGNTILTDKRMSLFSWWFEKSALTALQDGQITYSLTSSSMAVKNIEKYSIQDLLKESEKIKERATFFSKAEQNALLQKKENIEALYQNTLDEFLKALNTLQNLSEKGQKLCNMGLNNPSKAQMAKLIADLQSIDTQILTSSAKEAASLVFPTQRQLDKLTKDLPTDPIKKQFMYSKIIYQELLKAIKEYINAFSC